MPADEHVLSEKRDGWFLKMGTKDTYLQQEFRPGDRIVVCENCRKIWLSVSWNDQNCCPARGCGSKKTMKFSKRIFAFSNKMSGSGKKVILNGIEGVHFTVWEKLGIKLHALFDRFKERRSRRTSSRGRTYSVSFDKLGRLLGIKLCPGVKKAKIVLLIFAAVLAIYQFNVGESKLNGRSRFEYRAVVSESAVRMASLLEQAEEFFSYLASEWKEKGVQQAVPKLSELSSSFQEKAVTSGQKVKEVLAEGLSNKIRGILEEIKR